MGLGFRTLEITCQSQGLGINAASVKVVCVWALRAVSLASRFGDIPGLEHL